MRISAHQRAFEKAMNGDEPLLRAKSRCVGWWGAMFGHNWLTCSQAELVPDENRVRVYTARRCRRCYAEDQDFGRHYRKPTQALLVDDSIPYTPLLALQKPDV